MSWQLAQVNIARTNAPFSDPAMVGMTARIAEMNALAESSAGFVWRFTAESNDANRLDLFADYVVPFDRDCFFFNMSVWETIESLRRYAFEGGHLEVFRERHAWMAPFSRAHSALWWLPRGETPSVRDALERLISLDRNGPAPFAFTFAKHFPPPPAGGANN